MAAGTYNVMEPTAEQQLSGGLPGGAPLGFTASAQTSLFATTSFLYTASIMLIVAVAAGRYMLAGVWRIQASESAVTRSNKEIRRVTFGLLGVLSLFVILYTFNKGLLRGDVGLDGLSVSPQTGGSGLSGVVPVKQTNTAPAPFIPTHNDDPLGWNAIKEDPAMRAQLAALPNGGVSVNKSVCITPTQTGCTTVGGWPPETPAMLAQLRTTCPGNIQVTGGTEAGHQSHGPGKTPVDLSLNDSNLESCVRHFPVAATPNFCYKAYQKFGYVFCDEISVPRHWHAYKP